MPRDTKAGYQSQSQIYDTSLKELIEQQAPTILSHLIEGVTYTETMNVEIVRPTMRADRVYKVIYRDKPHILHIEFQISADADLSARLLVYCSVLYQDHHLPVISIVVCPFRTTLVRPPLCVMSGEQEMMRLDYLVLPLFEEDATKYIRDHALSMYPLLPAMLHVDHALIKRAINELQDFYCDQEIILAQQFTWMIIFLERSHTIGIEEKQKIYKELKMLDRLWDESPRVQQTLARGKTEGLAEGLALGKAEGLAQGLAEGLAQGKAEGLRLSVVAIVATRFSQLTELAEQKVATIDKLDQLQMLLQQIIAAPSEEITRFLLLPADK